MEDIHRNGRMGVGRRGRGREFTAGEESSLQVKTLKASYLAYIKGQPINFCSTLQIRSLIQTLTIAANILSHPSACSQSSTVVC